MKEVTFYLIDNLLFTQKKVVETICTFLFRQFHSNESLKINYANSLSLFLRISSLAIANIQVEVRSKGEGLHEKASGRSVSRSC